MRFVGGSWSEFWKSLRFDAVHPPLDYLAVRFVERWKPADWQRKIPDVVWGVAAIASLALLLRRRAGTAAGLLAASLLALAPFHVRYSQELRPYALGLLLLPLSLLCLDLFLDRPTAPRLAALYFASLACAYALYFSALVLAVGAAGMLVEDAFGREPERRRAARRFLLWSPAFAAALWIGYLPWWPVVVEAARRPPVAAAVPLTASRFARTFAFFAFAPGDGSPPGAAGLLFLALVAVGLLLSLRQAKLRFLAAWCVGGFLAIEIVGQLHPHYDFDRRFLPAGLAIPALAALALAPLFSSRRRAVAGVALFSAVLLCDARGLAAYFREGRADWRILARWVNDHALPGEKIFSENQYTQLCLGFYLSPHDRGGVAPREIPVLNLDGEIVRLTWSWVPGSRAWLVFAGEPRFEKLRRWAEIFPADSVPPAEGAVVRRLEPARRDAAFARVPP